MTVFHSHSGDNVSSFHYDDEGEHVKNYVPELCGIMG